MDEDRGAEFEVTWALFVKLEEAPLGELKDVEAFYDAAAGTIGTDGLLRGWGLVAARLRDALREHASKIGCDCGSDQWLREVQLHNAEEPGG